MTQEGAPPLELKFGGRLVEQLGAQMYPSATATVAELISNAWDADARNVWVQMPFGDWSGGELIVTDDGNGMDEAEAQEAYLVVGRNRRAGGRQRTGGRGRLVHGRKGIGKLAAFGTATVLEVKTRKDPASEVAFRLDYDNLRQQPPDVPYQVEASEDGGRLANPATGEPLPHGTRIRLSGLRLKRRLNPDQFTTSMSRRFALDEHEMAVFINGERLRRFDIDLQFRFPPDRLPPEAVADGKWASEELPNGRVVRWWIGFTPKPLKDDAQQGISVIVRGKLAQRPFKFDAGGGTTGQLGQEYLVGEVEADWIDDEQSDSTTDSDLIQSNRDQLQLEDDDLAPFLEWGRRRLRWALNARDEMKREQQKERLQRNVALERLLDGKTKRERDALARVAAAVARLPEAGEQDVVRVMEAVIGARSEETTRALAHDIALAGGDADDLFALVRELAQLDARSALVFLEARLETLAQMQDIDPAAAIDHILELVAVSPGLLNAHWEFSRVQDIVEMQQGANLVLLHAELNGRPDAALLVVSPAVSESDGLALAARVEAEHPRRELLIITGHPTEPPKTTSWADAVASAHEQHRLWRELVADRLTSGPWSSEP